MTEPRHGNLVVVETDASEALDNRPVKKCPEERKVPQDVVMNAMSKVVANTPASCLHRMEQVDMQRVRWFKEGLGPSTHL